MAYEIDYSDHRFAENEAEKQRKLTETQETYDGMIADTKKQYEKWSQDLKDQKAEQEEVIQRQTDFAVEQLEKQKEENKKDYIKEQSASYADWQKESAKHGVAAERMAEMGMSGTGYSETSKVRMYTAYQNRVAIARAALKDAETDYETAMEEARLQGSVAMAELAAQTYQQQLTLSINGFNAENQLIRELLASKEAIENNYYTREQNIIAQITAEIERAEAARQAELNRNLQYAQLAEEKRQFDAMYGTSLIEDDEEVEINGETSRTLSTPNSRAPQIKTKYYSGPIAQNVGGFGYMGKDDNGVAYQPKGIFLDGKAYKLKKSGSKVKDYFGSDVKNSSGVNVANQNIWEANGMYFVWNGTENRYEELDKEHILYQKTAAARPNNSNGLYYNVR